MEWTESFRYLKDRSHLYSLMLEFYNFITLLIMLYQLHSRVETQKIKVIQIKLFHPLPSRDVSW